MLVANGVHYIYRGVSLYEMHAGGKWEIISQLGVAQLQLQYMHEAEWADIRV